MKKLSCLLVLAMMTSPAWADCTYPKAPTKFPNGKSASKDEMLAAMQVNKTYQSDVSAYQDCLKAEHDAALAKDAAMTDDQKQALTKRYIQKNDAAVDEAKEVAARFNSQVQAFNAKNKK
jgi:hypothetical protein